MRREALQKGINSSQAITGMLLSVYGLIKLLLDLQMVTNSTVLPSIAGMLLVLLWIGPAVYELIPPEPLRRFGLNRLRSDRICTYHHKTVDIDDNLHAMVTVTQNWVFLEEPDQQDLSESYSIDPKLSIHDFPYCSPDGVEVSRKRTGKGSVTIFWQPRDPIIPFTEYVHRDEWTPPVPYDQPACYTEYHCVYKTGYFQTVVRAPFMIESAIVFKRPSFRRLRSDNDFMRFAIRKRHRSWGTWQIQKDGHGLLWTIVNPHVNKSYVCVFFKVGGKHYWEKRLSEASVWNNLRSGSVSKA